MILDGYSEIIGSRLLSGKIYEFGDIKDVSDGSNYAQNTVVLKVIGNLTVKEGVTLTSFKGNYGGPKGMIIYCTGDIHNHGDISMSSRGAYAEGENVYIYKNNDNIYEFVPSFGAKGGIGRGFSYNNTWGKGPIIQLGTNGKNGVGRESGGGGSGCNYLVLEKYVTGNSRKWWNRN